MCRSFIPSTQLTTTCGNTTTSSNIGSANTAFLLKNLAQHLAHLLKVIRSQRWSSFDRIVLSSPNVFSMLSNEIRKYDDEFKNMPTLLHACLRYSPPLEVIVKMLKMLSQDERTSALRTRDFIGMTPLHVAAACCADPMVIKVLGSVDPTSCSILDDAGRTPLHLACDSNSSCNTLQNDKTNNSTQPKQQQQQSTPSYEAVHALLSVSLYPALVEDEDGMSALEYAIISDAPLQVVDILQKASMRELRNRQQEQQRINDINKNRRCDVLSV